MCSGAQETEGFLGAKRRGWAEKKDIINTMSYEELIKFLKKKN